MNHSGVHSYEDKLVEFAYGELPAAEARSVEDHLKGCARCASALESLQGVRRTMSQLGAEPAPSAGLDSLMAYAEQTARRLQAGPAPRAVWWRRLLVPVTSLAALAVVALVVVQTDNSKLSPSAMLKEEAVAEKAAAREEGSKALDKAPAEPVAQAPVPAAAQAPEPAGAQAPEPYPEDGRALPKPPAAPSLPEPMQAMKDGKLNMGKRRAGFAQDDSGELDELSGALSTGGMKKKAPSKMAYAKEEKARVAPSDDYDLVAAQPEASTTAPAGEAAAEMREREDFNRLQQMATQKVDARSEAKPSAAPKRGYAEEQGYGLGSFGAAGGGEGAGSIGAGVGQQKQAEEPASKLSLRSPSSTSVSRDAPAESSDDEFSSSFGNRELSRKAAQPAAAAPPPPPASSAGYALGGAEARAPVMNKGDQLETKAGPAENYTSTLERLVRLAEKARHGNDREGEVRLLRKAIDAGATGTQLAQILSQLCDAEIALGGRQPASCQRLLAEFPNSSFAEHAQFQTKPMERTVPSRAKAAPATKPANAAPSPAY